MFDTLPTAVQSAADPVSTFFPGMSTVAHLESTLCFSPPNQSLQRRNSILSEAGHLKLTLVALSYFPLASGSLTVILTAAAEKVGWVEKKSEKNML